MYNRLILVTGSGRAGTSLFTGILSALGCHVPQPEAGVDPGAPKGFGETQWVANLHTSLLRRAGVEVADARPSAWAQTAALGREPGVQTRLENWLRGEFGKPDHVVVKDPRLSWFVPAWRRAGETVAAPCFVLVVRHPLEVITSNEVGYADRWKPNARVAGWLNTMLYTERATRGDRRAIVRREDLKTDAMLAVSRASEQLDLDVVDRASPPQMRVATDLVEPTTRRSRATWASLEVDHRLVELAEDVHKTFSEAANTIEDQAVISQLDTLRQRYVDLYGFAESTAQHSTATAGRSGRSSPSSPTANGSVLSPDMMRKLLQRAKRRGKQKIHQLRPRGGSTVSRKGE